MENKKLTAMEKMTSERLYACVDEEMTHIKSRSSSGFSVVIAAKTMISILSRSDKKREVQKPQVSGGVWGGAPSFPRYLTSSSGMR